MLVNIILLLMALTVTLTLVAVWYAWTYLYVTVPKDAVAFIERKGRHCATLTEGRYIISPKDKLKRFTLDGITTTSFVSTTQQQLPCVAMELITSDGLILNVTVTAEYQITNTVTVVYKEINVEEYALRIIKKAVKTVMEGKSCETLENYLDDFMEAAAIAASRMAINYGFRITMSELSISDDASGFEGYDNPMTEDDGFFYDGQDIPDIEDEKNSLPSLANDMHSDFIEENPMPHEEDEIIDMTPKVHLYLHYSENYAEFNDDRHLSNFLNYLFRSDRKQKNTTENTDRNLYAIRQPDGIFRIYGPGELSDKEERMALQKETLDLLRGIDYYNIINDEVLVNLYKGDIQYLRDDSQLITLEKEQEEYVFRKLVERYQRDFPPVVACAMHNDQDYGGRRILNHIHRVIAKTIPYERGGIPEES